MKKGRIIRIILAAFFSAVFVFSAYKLINIYSGYKEAEDFYEDVRDEYIVTTEETAETEKDEEETQAKAALPFTVDFDSLKSYNPDVVGWIYCPDTEINYPVAQSDDNDYYLRRALDGSYLVTGTVFADYRNTEPLTERNYIVYGHYMKDGSIFGCFEKFENQSFYESHPVMYYFTPNQNYKIELFAGLLTNTEEFPYETDFSDGDFESLLIWAKDNSFFDSRIEAGIDDKIITLSTCSYEYENARTVLLGKLCPIE